MSTTKVRVRATRDHLRAGHLFTAEYQEFEATDEQLRLLVRDPELVVDGHPHVPRSVWEPEEYAAFKARDLAAGQIEDERKRALANAQDAASSKQASAAKAGK